MRKLFFILTTLFAINANAQVEKELKTSGSLAMPEIKNASDTGVRISFHCGAASYSTKKPLLIINGIRKPYDYLSKIDVNTVESVFVMKSEEAIKKYGRKAKAGVIVVKMKMI